MICTMAGTALMPVPEQVKVLLTLVLAEFNVIVPLTVTVPP
jgi:hypothetical protein